MTESIETLKKKIATKDAKVAVIGLGYVGLPVACMVASEGYNVIGIDINKTRVDQIKQGQSPMLEIEPGLSELIREVVSSRRLSATADYEDLRDVDIALINVETPIDQNNVPQYQALHAACESLGKVMKPGILVIVESTIAPGTMNGFVRPVLETASELKSGKDFFLGTCPERVMPGKLLKNLRVMSRVCGGESPPVAKTMKLFYQQFVNSDLDEADMITAELTKTAENAYRDVNIAFANELALICQSIGADFLKVRELVNKSPGRNVLLAGGGVGGHCIPKDPWLLAHGVREILPLKLIPAARTVNDAMPNVVAEMAKRILEYHGKSIKKSSIAVFGYAYLEESDDTRNSPSERVIELLESHGAEVYIHDPYVSRYQKNLMEIAKGCDMIILMVAHQVYRNLNLENLKHVITSPPIFLDARRVIDPAVVEQSDYNYYGIGLGNPHFLKTGS